MGGLSSRPKGPKQIYEPQHIAEDDFTCPVCYDLMVDPTTLTCGHSFCRHCMAQWYFESSNKECPQCRQRLVGHPQVNFAMKATAEKLFADRLRRRVKLIETDSEKQRYLAKYNILSQPTTTPPPKHNFDTISFVIGVFATVLTVTVAYLLWAMFWLLFGSSSSEDYTSMRRPSKRWSTAQVVDWVAELWPAAGPDGILSFIEDHHIDGRLLYELVRGLTVVVRAGTWSHIPAFLGQLNMSVIDIHAKDEIPPLSLWQYKELHFGQTMILLVLVRNFIRPALLYILLFFGSSHAWVPILYKACSAMHDVNTSPLSCLDGRQWFDLIFEWIFFPYFLVLRFIFHSGLLSTNFWSASLYTSLCIALGCQEIMAVVTLYQLDYRRRIAHLKVRLNQYVSDAGSCFIIILIGTIAWNIIPTFVWNVLFFYKFYFEPAIYLLQLNSPT